MKGFSSKFSRVPKHSKFHYEPRYVKEEKGLENRKSSIKLEKGAFFKHSKTLSKFRDPSITHYKHNTKSRKNTKYVLSISMMSCIYIFFTKGGTAGLFSLALLLILLIIFIRINNKN